jgi:predicted nucleotidyltransferase
MAPEISTEQMALYRATAQQRWQQKEHQLALRYRRAGEVARQAAVILKEQFGAQRVVIFGSALFAHRFHQHSDVDLAVWGLDEKVYYRAVARLLDIEPTIPVDLVEAELASAPLLRAIEKEGVTL